MTMKETNEAEGGRRVQIRREPTTSAGVAMEYLRTAQALEYLPISRRTLERMKRRGQIPYIRATARLCLFRKTDIDRALEKLTVRPVG